MSCSFHLEALAFMLRSVSHLRLFWGYDVNRGWASLSFYTDICLSQYNLLKTFLYQWITLEFLLKLRWFLPLDFLFSCSDFTVNFKGGVSPIFVLLNLFKEKVLIFSIVSLFSNLLILVVYFFPSAYFEFALLPSPHLLKG